MMTSLRRLLLRNGRAVPPQQQLRWSSSLPDLTTPVDVASIRLTKPKRTGRREGSWLGLPGLEARIQKEGSLIEETLKEMESDPEFQLTAKRLQEAGQAKLTLEEKKRRRRALDAMGVPDFAEFLQEAKVADVGVRRATKILQVNVGLYCNQACGHCHVESSPKRTETMSAAVAERCVELIAASPSVETLDITGGAPELNASFRRLVDGALGLSRDVEVIDRCNLTVLSEPGQEDLAEYLAERHVRVVASLPCYSSKNVDQQRGKGVFDRSIAGLRKLNDVGYGVDPGLVLDLVYNPLGAFLPPDQAALESKYREELREHFGVEFNGLFTMTNMPIKRFADFLFRRGELEEYMELLVRNFNVSTTPSLMCRDTLSVDYDGKLFDCDFNQQLRLPFTGGGLSVFDLPSTDALLNKPIRHDNHCFGCTAGMGSS